MTAQHLTSIRLKVHSYDVYNLDVACEMIHKIFYETKTTISQIYLPNTQKIYCVLRSPHVDKDSREHFECRIHKRLVEIYYDPEFTDILSILKKLDLPSGVHYCIGFSN